MNTLGPELRQRIKAHAAKNNGQDVEDTTIAQPEPQEEADGADRALFLPGKEPLTIARTYVARCGSSGHLRTLQHWGQEFFRYENGRGYRPVPKEYLRAALWKWLEGATVGAICEPYNPNSRRVSEIIDALAAACQVEVEGMPAWLRRDDQTPDPRNIIAFPNGLLDLASYLDGNIRLLPPSPLWFSTNALPYPFDADAGEPTEWLRFLDSIWPDDSEPILALQQMFGYALTQDTEQQKIFLIVGPKRSGKGTMARMLTHVIGENNVCAPTLAGLATNFGMWPLIGKQLGIISDARLSARSDQAIVTERLLSISGQDAVTIDRKNMSPLTLRLFTRFLILSNELPRLADASGALPSRFIVWTMEKSFYGKEDTGLTDRLIGERQAIALWALEGLRALRSVGRFLQPSGALDAIQEMEDLASPISAFIRERCVVQPGRSIDCDQLFAAWRAWCTKQGRDQAGTLPWFGRDLRAALPGIAIKVRRIPGDGYSRIYEGIDLEND